MLPQFPWIGKKTAGRIDSLDHHPSLILAGVTAKIAASQ
jgi:hypothetical protein